MKRIVIALILTGIVACGEEQPQKQMEPGAGGVNLKVELPDAEPIEATIEVQGTVLTLMEKASQENLLTFKKEGDGEKALITAIQGIGPSGDAERGKYWIYAVNGQLATVGVGSMRIKTGDNVRWCYLTYENRKSCGETVANPEEAAE